MGNNGGFNPYRDQNGRWATPENNGKVTRSAKEARAIWTDKPPPKTSRLGKPAGWAYRPSSLPPGYRGKAKAPPKAPTPKPQAPQVPKKYRDYSDMSSRVDKLEQQLKQAERAVEAASWRSRFPSYEAQKAAQTKAQAAAETIRRQLNEVRRDRNEYLDAMARYRSQDDYRYDD